MRSLLMLLVVVVLISSVYAVEPSSGLNLVDEEVFFRLDNEIIETSTLDTHGKTLFVSYMVLLEHVSRPFEGVQCSIVTQYGGSVNSCFGHIYPVANPTVTLKAYVGSREISRSYTRHFGHVGDMSYIYLESFFFPEDYFPWYDVVTFKIIKSGEGAIDVKEVTIAYVEIEPVKDEALPFKDEALEGFEVSDFNIGEAPLIEGLNTDKISMEFGGDLVE